MFLQYHWFYIPSMQYLESPISYIFCFLIYIFPLILTNGFVKRGSIPILANLFTLNLGTIFIISNWQWKLIYSVLVLLWHNFFSAYWHLCHVWQSDGDEIVNHRTQMDEMNEGILHVLFVDLRGTFYHAFTRPTSLYGARWWVVRCQWS